MNRRVLLIGGSLNQTTMMEQIAGRLADCDCWFSRFYVDRPLERLAEAGLLDFSILGGRHRRSTEEHLRNSGLPVDHGGRQREYDLVVIGTDLILPGNLRGRRLVLVQEGLMESAGAAYWAVRRLGLPRYLANTAATGLSHAYDVFCVASDGYRDDFIARGVPAEKIRVTGIPNFDDLAACRENDFPHRGYILAATSNARETFKRDDRPGFIRWVLQIAAGRPVLFKLHPNERIERAQEEISRLAPTAQVIVDGDIRHLVANCAVLVTQYSSVTFLGLVLGKEVHSYLDVDRLRRLLPIQNGGASAANIAAICRQLLSQPVRRQVGRTGLGKLALGT